MTVFGANGGKKSLTLKLARLSLGGCGVYASWLSFISVFLFSLSLILTGRGFIKIINNYKIGQIFGVLGQQTINPGGYDRDEQHQSDVVTPELK